MSEVAGGDAAKAKSLEKPRQFLRTKQWAVTAFIAIFAINILLLIAVERVLELGLSEIFELMFSPHWYLLLELSEIFKMIFSPHWYVFWIPNIGASAATALTLVAGTRRRILSKRRVVVVVLGSLIVDVVVFVGLFGCVFIGALIRAGYRS